MSTDLIAELRAALDAEEAAARAAFGKWGGVEGTDWIIEVGLPLDEWQPPGYGNNLGSIRLEEHRKHIIRHDPLTVLADIAAKRGIIECHEPWTAANGDIICGRCGREHIDGRPGGHYPCQTMRLLAEAYGIRADG